MSASTRISDFVKAARPYATSAVRRANADGSTYLTAAEAATLPKDLRDNFAALGKSRVSAKGFVDGFAAAVATHARRADRNGDGLLSESEARRLPAGVRDNFRAFARAQAAQGVRDTTTASVRAAHAREYASAISYADAFRRASHELLTSDAPEGPRATLQEFADEPLSDAALDALIRKQLHGLKLLPVGEAEESYGDPEAEWIFRVDVDTGTDHGFWASVDRQTGEVSISNFN